MRPGHIRGWVVGAFFGCCVTAAQAQLIGVDDRSGTDYENFITGADFESFNAEVRQAGTIVPLGSFTQGSLAGLDAVVLRQPAGLAHGLSQQSIDALHAFVAAGGGLVLFAEGGHATGSTTANFNAIAAPYGVTFGSLIEGGTGYTLTGLVGHPLTDGVSTIGLDFYRPMVSIASPAMDLTTAAGIDDVLAAVTGTGGAGNVVLFSDPTAFIDAGAADRSIAFGDNRRLLQNMLSFALVPEPGGLLASVVVASHVLWRRPRRAAKSKEAKS